MEGEMIRTIALVALAVGIAGCSTTTPAERLAQNQTTCERYGFKTGTDAYATCLMNLDQNQAQEERDRMRRVGAALSQMGNTYSQPRRTVTCNTFGTRTGTFNNATTTCY
jgi:hypothetical protein